MTDKKNAVNDAKLAGGGELSFAASEAYKRLRTALIFSLPKKENQIARIIGMTSAAPGEGKSTTSIHLAYAMADVGKKTLLIEADMRLPGISKFLNLSDVQGLSDYLAGEVDDEINIISRIEAKENLFILPAGSIPPNPSELLDSSRMNELLQKLSDKFDFIIIDLPPVGAVVDALIVGKLVDGMLLVVRKDYGNKKALNDAVRQCNFSQIKILGFVFNDASSNGKKYTKKKYYYQDYERAK